MRSHDLVVNSLGNMNLTLTSYLLGYSAIINNIFSRGDIKLVFYY